MKNLNLNKLRNFKLIRNVSVRNYIISYPSASVRINKKTGEIIPPDQEIEAKKPEEIKYSNKYEINPDNINDYEIIGAEIFKNMFKETLERTEKGEPYQSVMDSVVKEQMEQEIYAVHKKELAWQEPHKYYKHFTRRTFYDQAHPNYRHMFVPSYRYKIEPFNSIRVFKFPLLDSDRKAHNENVFKRNSFVPGFSPPFNTNNPQVEKIISDLEANKRKFGLNYNSPEFQKTVNDIYNKPENSTDEAISTYAYLIDQLLNLLPNLHFKIYPNLLMKLFYDLGLNSRKLWIAFEQEIMNNLHHFTIPEICQINFIVSISSPKYTSDNFRRLLIQTAYNQLEGNNLNLQDLYSISLGFRYTKNKFIYDKLAENFIKRKMNFIGDGNSNTSSILSEIFYSWGANKPRQDTVRTFYQQRELEQNFIETYEDDLNNNILKMSQDDIWRFTTSLYLLKTDNVDPFINRIERNLLKVKALHPDKIDSYGLYNVLRAFSKMRNGKMTGSDKFFNEMEPIVIQNIENFKYSFQQITDILYAYSVRGSGSEKLYNLFNKKINEDIDKANNYHILANIVYYYLFNENKNTEQWSLIMKKFNEIEERVPIYYYRPFKIAGFYLEHALFQNEALKNKIDCDQFIDFKDRFFDPDQIYDYVKYEQTFHLNPEYSSLKAMLNSRLLLFPIPHLVLENMFMIHNCWEIRKMGINLWLDRDQITKPNGPNRISKHCYLHSQMLKYQGWEILDIVWEDFMNLGSQTARDKILHDWFFSTSIKQEQKGVFKINPQFV